MCPLSAHKGLGVGTHIIRFWSGTDKRSSRLARQIAPQNERLSSSASVQCWRVAQKTAQVFGAVSAFNRRLVDRQCFVVVFVQRGLKLRGAAFSCCCDFWTALCSYYSRQLAPLNDERGRRRVFQSAALNFCAYVLVARHYAGEEKRFRGWSKSLRRTCGELVGSSESSESSSSGRRLLTFAYSRALSSRSCARSSSNSATLLRPMSTSQKG